MNIKRRIGREFVYHLLTTRWKFFYIHAQYFFLPATDWQIYCANDLQFLTRPAISFNC